MLPLLCVPRWECKLTEARMNGWLGEVNGLTVSLHATTKLTDLDRAIARARGPVSIGRVCSDFG